MVFGCGKQDTGAVTEKVWFFVDYGLGERLVSSRERVLPGRRRGWRVTKGEVSIGMRPRLEDGR